MPFGINTFVWVSPLTTASIEALAPKVKAMGFDLLVKRAKIGQQKHIRVRPQFTSWEARGAFLVWDDQIDEKALALILEYAGQYKGLCDWRPGGRTPGPYGTFEAKIG